MASPTPGPHEAAGSPQAGGPPPGNPSPGAPAGRPNHGPDHPWESCVWPFIAFMALGTLEPTPSGDGLAGSLGIPYSAYPAVYALRLAVTIALVAWQWPNIRRWLGRPVWWAPLLGVLLVIPWVVLATMQREAGLADWLDRLLGAVGFGAGGTGERAAFNPFEAWGKDSATTFAYLALRGLGLVVVVPLVEELFLRGFLMRYVVDEEFHTVPFGTLTGAAVGVCAFYAVGTHPGEAVAALVWFGIVSGITAATRQPIDGILAHAGTNLALGAWVLWSGQWWLV